MAAIAIDGRLLQQSPSYIQWLQSIDNNRVIGPVQFMCYYWEAQQQHQFSSFELQQNIDVLKNFTTIISEVPTGSIWFTLIVSILLCILLLFLFFCCFKHFTLFNNAKKKKLIEQIRLELRHTKNKQQVTEEDEKMLEEQVNENIVEELSDYKTLLSLSQYGNQITDQDIIDLEETITLQYEQRTPIVDTFPSGRGRADSILVKGGNKVKEFFAKCRKWFTFQAKNISQFLRELFKFLFMLLLSFVSFKYNRQDMVNTYKSYGRDVAVYFKFQKEIVLAMFLCTVLGCVVLLPIHATGSIPTIVIDQSWGNFNLTKEDYPLLYTTISMVADNPTRLYAHVALTVLFILIYAIFLFRFLRSDIVTQKHFEIFEAEQKYNQLMNSNVSAADGEDIIHDVLEEEKDEQERREAQIASIQQAKIKKTVTVGDYCAELYSLSTHFTNPYAFDYFVREELCKEYKVFKTVILIDIHERIRMQKSIEYYQDKLDHYDYLVNQHKMKKKPTTWAFVKVFPFISFSVDAIDHYSKKVAKLKEKIQNWDEQYVKSMYYAEQSKSIKSSGSAIIVFETKADARDFIAKHGTRGTIHRTITMVKPVHSQPQSQPQPSSTASTPQEDLLSKSHNSIPEKPLLGNNEPTVVPKKHISFRVKKPYEPADIIFDNFYTYRKITDAIRNYFIEIVLIVVYVFFSSPMSVVSGVQELSKLPLFQESILLLRWYIGFIGDTIFQYLPTLILHLFTTVLPLIIWYVSEMAKYRSKSRYKRKLIIKMYAYLTLSTLVMPSILLTSIDAVIKYLITRREFFSLIEKIFLPVSGAFFLNFVLQSGLLKNFQDFVRVGNTLNFLVHIPFAKTPKEKLRAANLGDFFFDYEYAYMLSIMNITLCYSLFSPVILPCGLLYFSLKFIFDRYIVLFIYGHKKLPREYLTADFRSHQQLVHLIAQLLLFNLLLFVLIVFLFFFSKVRTMGLQLLPHTIILGLLLLGLGFYIIVNYFMGNDIVQTLVDFIAKKPKYTVSIPNASANLPLAAKKKREKYKRRAFALAFEPPKYIKQLLKPTSLLRLGSQQRSSTNQETYTDLKLSSVISLSSESRLDTPLLADDSIPSVVIPDIVITPTDGIENSSSSIVGGESSRQSIPKTSSQLLLVDENEIQ